MTLLQSTTPVQLSASIMNQGNLPIPAGPYELIVRMEVPELQTGGSTTELSAIYDGAAFVPSLMRAMVRDPEGNLFTLHGSTIFRTVPGGATSVWYQIPTTINGCSASYVDLDVLGVNRLLIGGTQCVHRLAPDLTITSTKNATVRTVRVAAGANNAIYLMDSQGVTQLVGEQQETRLIGLGLSRPNRVRKRSNGELLIANSNAGTVTRYENGRMRDWVNGIPGATGLALAANGDAYVLNTTARALIKVQPDGTKTQIASGFSTPSDVVVRQADQSLLVLDSGSKEILKASAGASNEAWLQGMVFNSQALDFASDGTLYLANQSDFLTRQDANGARFRYPSTTTGVEDLSLAVDGSLYATQGSALKKLQANGSLLSVWSLSGSTASRLVADGGSNVYFNTGSLIRRYQGAATADVVARSFVDQAYDLAIDAAGSVVVVNDTSVVRAPATGTPEVLQASTDYFRSAYVLSDGSTLVGGWRKIFKRSPSGQVTQVAAPPNTYVEGVFGRDNGEVYYLEYGHPLRKIDSQGVVSDIYTRTGLYAYAGSESAHYLLDSQARIWKYVEGSPAPTVHLAQVTAGSNLNLGADGKLYVAANNRIVRVDPQSGAQQVMVTAPVTRNFQSAVMLADGRIAALDRAIRVLWYYNDQGQEVDNLAGYASIADLEWFNDRVWIGDSNRLLSFSPNDFRIRQEGVVGGTGIRLAANQDRLLVSFGASITRWNNGATELLHTTRRNAVVSSLALAANGEVAFATQAHELYRLNASGAVMRYQPSLDGIVGAAEDAQGRLYIGSSNGLWRMNADGLDGDYFSVGQVRFVSMAPDGKVLLCNTSNLRTFDPLNGQATVLAAAPCEAPLADGSGVLYTDQANRLTRREGSAVNILSSGLTSPSDIAFAQNALWVADNSNHSIGRLDANGFELVSTAVANPNRMAVMSDGDLLVLNNAKESYVISAGVVSPGLPTAPLLVQGTKVDIAGKNANEIFLLSSAPVGIERIRAGEPIVPIAPGTIVHRVERQLPLLNPGDTPVVEAFGSFKPTQGGDYAVEVKSLTAGIGGLLNTSLHVGPLAEGIISTDRQRISPSEAQVNVTVDLRGLDYSALARPEVAALQAFPLGAADYVYAFGMDAQGRAILGQGNTIRRVTLGGTTPTSEVLANELVNSHGRIPVDAQGNIYYGQGNNLKKLSASGVVSTLKAYASTVVGVEQLSTGRLVVATYSHGMFTINPDGTDGRSFATTPTPFSITTDGMDNVYVQANFTIPHPTIANRYVHPILKVTPQGVVSTVIQSPSFENEGANIAGDCAENLFIAPTNWPEVGQNAEEHIVGQRNGRSGSVGAILNTRLINTNYADLDTMVYDRFQSALQIWNHGGGNFNAILRIPVTCGAITTRLVAVVPPNQPVGSFVPAPIEQLTLADGAKQLTWVLTDLGSITRRVSLQTQLKDVRLGQSRTVFREAYLQFKNSFQPTQDIRAPLAIPSLEAGNIMDGALTVSAASFPQNSDVGISQSLSNNDTQAVSGELLMEVIDTEGTRVKELLREMVSLAGNGNLERTPAFNTGQTIAGPYRVRTQLLDGNQVAMASWVRDFVITSGSGVGPQVETQVSPEKPEYDANQRVLFNLRAKNLANNVLLENLRASLTIKQPDGSVWQTLNAEPFQLAPGAQHLYQQSLQLAQAQAGLYQLEQKVSTATGTVLATASGSFRVRAIGGSLELLSGTLAALPASLEVGTSTRLDALLSNGGTDAMTQVPVELVVIDQAGERNYGQWQSLRDVAAGGSGTSFSETWNSFGAVPGNYLAVLRAGPEGAQRVLAETRITLTAPQISFAVQQAVERDTRLLVLVGCKVDASEATCTATRRDFLRTYLSALGVDHSVVTTGEQFASEFRSGRYNTFWLAGSARKLRGRPPQAPDTLLKSGFEFDEDASTLTLEMLEAVRRGASLWLDGAYHPLQFELMPALGVNYLGLGATNPQVSLNAGVYQPGIFAVTGQAERYQTVSAVALAQFQDNSPAIFSNAFGDGRALVMGFDFVATLAAQTPVNATAAGVLDRSLLHLLPPLPLDYVAGDYFPLTTRVTNQSAGTVNTRISSTRSPGVGLWRLLPSSGSQTGSQITWQEELASLQAKRYEVDLRLPLLTGDAPFALTRISSVRAGNLVVPFAEPRFPLHVLDRAQVVEQLTQAITLYPLGGAADQEYRRRALERLSMANDEVTQGRAARSFTHFIATQENLRLIAALSTAPEQQQVTNLLREAQHQWHATVPACAPESQVTQVPEYDFRLVGAHHGLEIRGGSTPELPPDFETALGPNLLNASGTSLGQMNWVSGREYRVELAIQANGEGALLIKDGATTVLTQNYPANGQPLLRGNAVKWVLTSNDSTGAKLDVRIVSINDVAIDEALSSVANAGYQRLTRSYLAASGTQPLRVAGTVKFTFSTPLPPPLATLTLRVQPGYVSCRTEAQP
jgi:hypothetical protein